MATKQFINHKCPICGYMVGEIPDHMLKLHPHEDNVEFVVTKRGLKQYFHTRCFEALIENQKIEAEQHV